MQRKKAVLPRPELSDLSHWLRSHFVDGLANQAIRSTENLDWANEIKLLNWGHDNNDDSPSLEARTSVARD